MSALELKLRESWDPESWRDLTVVVAVSGGPDSVALLRCLAALVPSRQTGLIVAHFNHGWRGRRAHSDQHFVEQLAKRLGLPCEIGMAPQPAAETVPREETARNERHQFLKQVAKAAGARYVATGHTADDQAETVLQRIIRGTGLSGLAGIARARPLAAGVTLMHPLLTVRRSEVLEYLGGLGQVYCRDSTNQQLRFTRNRIRHRLLPQLAEEYNPHIVEALLRLGTLAGEAQNLLASQIEPLRTRAVSIHEGWKVVLDLSLLQQTPVYLVRELLIAIWKEQSWPLAQMSYDKWDGLARLTSSEAAGAARVIFPGGVAAQRRGSTLELCRAKSD